MGLRSGHCRGIERDRSRGDRPEPVGDILSGLRTIQFAHRADFFLLVSNLLDWFDGVLDVAATNRVAIVDLARSPARCETIRGQPRFATTNREIHAC